jgi:hypothetical protein
MKPPVPLHVANFPHEVASWHHRVCQAREAYRLATRLEEDAIDALLALHAQFTPDAPSLEEVRFAIVQYDRTFRNLIERLHETVQAMKDES